MEPTNASARNATTIENKYSFLKQVFVFDVVFREGFGPGPAQAPTNLGWAGLAQIGFGPENFGPKSSLILKYGFGFGSAQGPINLGSTELSFGPVNFGPNPSLVVFFA